MQTIFFFYGLAFLVMGVTILLMPKKYDLLGLSEDLWLIGLFGLLHGANEWVDMFLLKGPPLNTAFLTVLGALLLPISFAPLLQFGVRALFRGTRSFASLKYLWMIPVMGWSVTCFLTSGFLIPGIVARYFICFPGSLLAAAGLLRALWKADKKELPVTVLAGAIGSAAFFIFYSVLSGLVVPKAVFFMASFLHYPNFLQWTGVPVQFFRMICALCLAVSFFSLTGVYAFNPDKKRVIRRGGIQRKITLVLCGFNSIVALLIVGIIALWSYQVILADIKQEQLKAGKILSQSVNEMIDHEVDDLQIHLSSRAWQQAVEDANLRYVAMSSTAILKEFQEMDKKWIPAGKDSTFIRSYLETPLSQRLKALDEADKTIAEIFLTDRYGGLVAASGKTSDFYQADEDWWQKAYAGGKGSIFIGNVEVDESSGILSVLLAIPIRNKGNEVIGIAKESINVATFFSALKSYKYGKTGQASLIDGKGNILFHEGVRPFSAKFLNEEEMRTLVQNKTELIKKTEGIHRDATWFISVEKPDSPFLLRNGIVWYLCISRDAAEAFQPLKQLVIQMVLLLLILMVAVIFLGIIIGRRFAAPIRELQKAVEKVTAGATDYRIRIWTGDEIQEFAESFNTLIEQLLERQEKLSKTTVELEAFTSDLEKKVEERTQDLSEGQRATMNILEDLMSAKEDLETQAWGLQKANDGIRALYQELETKNLELDRLSQLKNDFVSIVAHELRNPLGIVREAAALVLDGLAGPVAESQKAYLEMIRRTSERLIHITSDLLDLAKIEAGKIVVNYEPMDFLSLARQCLEGIALRANKKGLKTSESFPGEKLEIIGDFEKLAQVLTNLLSNAYKFTEKGGITVEVKDLGEEICCAVKDTGVGISQEDITRLFSKFEQFGKPRGSADKGSGLGLVISKSIIEAHDGRIWAESEPGKGSSFLFTLPKNPKRKLKLGEILVGEKALTSEQLSEALQKQKEQKS